MTGLLRTETNETPSPRLTAWAMPSSRLQAPRSHHHTSISGALDVAFGLIKGATGVIEGPTIKSEPRCWSFCCSSVAIKVPSVKSAPRLPSCSQPESINCTPASALALPSCAERRSGSRCSGSSKMTGLLRTETNETPLPRLTAWATADR